MNGLKEATVRNIKTLYDEYSGATENKKGNIHLVIPQKTASTQCREMFTQASEKGKFKISWGDKQTHSGFSFTRRLTEQKLKKPALRIGLVRNPWDWLVSLYFLSSVESHFNNIDFKDFIYWWASNKPLLEHPHHGAWKSVEWAYSPMCQVFHDDGKLAPHIIMSAERVNEGCQMIFDALGINFKAEGNKNYNKNIQHKDKKDFYDCETAELVRKRMSMFIELFNYFDGPNTAWNYEMPVLINDGAAIDYLPIQGKDGWIQ